MDIKNKSSRGFTLIAALLMMVLLSGVAIGLMFMVTNNVHMTSNDTEQNLAYYGAESGIEKMTADLAVLYSKEQTPPLASIQAIATHPPDSTMVPGMTYTEQLTWTDSNGDGQPDNHRATITSGDNYGLVAEITPYTLQVNATRPSGASVSITRGVEVSQIPVFQFGVFCGFDCSYFAGPNFSFGGRVHTNGNLYLASGGSTLVFNDKVSAYGQIVMDRLENNWPATSNYNGTVWIPKASGGCPLNTFTGLSSYTNCVSLPGPASAPGYASWSGGIPTGAGSANTNFRSISSGAMNYFLTNSLTGTKNMQLPFVDNSCTSNPPPCTDPIEIIRRPPRGEVTSGSLSKSRLFIKAQIRVLLANNATDLHPDTPGTQPGDVQLTGSKVTVDGTEFFGKADINIAGSNWKMPLYYGALPATTYPLHGASDDATGAPTGQAAWLRIEYTPDDGTTFIPVTDEWLRYGFGRAYNQVPTTPGPNPAAAGANPINPNAIIILQQLRQAGWGTAQAFGGATPETNWYPINLYDAREGEARDYTTNYVAGSCTPNGIMNAVEIDVGNLKRWLNGTLAGSGNQVDYLTRNGYVLYFSDRRGMINDPNKGNALSGESGLEDVVNWTSAAGTPDGRLESTLTGLPVMYYTYSPEDANGNGRLDNWGIKNIGYGFGVDTNATPNPYQRINNCSTTGGGFANAVTGARHVLKLVDGSLGNLPVRLDDGEGGFTVASENPVYVKGNYNSSGADPFWTNNANNDTPHSAAAVIADAVTVLSNEWTDWNSMLNTIKLNNRAPNTDAYYRMAIAGGKNIPFRQPTWANVKQDFGTDGGLHNFIRELENWSGRGLWYNGSLVNLYYAEYNTGTFKCCDTVYGAPTRKFYFDTLFLDPTKLPPATPMFQDVVNLSYHQNFTPQ